MADRFGEHMAGLDSPALRCKTVAASALEIDPRPRAIRCDVAGSITIEDEDGTTSTLNIAAGEILPVRPLKVTAITGMFFALS